jgi:phosphate starvation-inducible membrane PsiE
MSDQERIEAKLRTESRFRNGASWFYWIAGLSLLNCVINLFNGSVSFISGLGITQMIDGTAYAMKDFYGVGVMYFGFVLNLIIIAGFFLLGRLAYKRKKWAMIVGIILYGLDTFNFLFVTDYLSIGFHIIAIYSIFRGIKAADKLKVLEAMGQISAADEEVLLNS